MSVKLATFSFDLDPGGMAKCTESRLLLQMNGVYGCNSSDTFIVSNGPERVRSVADVKSVRHEVGNRSICQ